MTNEERELLFALAAQVIESAGEAGPRLQRLLDRARPQFCGHGRRPGDCDWCDSGRGR